MLKEHVHYVTAMLDFFMLRDRRGRGRLAYLAPKKAKKKKIEREREKRKEKKGKVIYTYVVIERDSSTAANSRRA